MFEMNTILKRVTKLELFLRLCLLVSPTVIGNISLKCSGASLLIILYNNVNFFILLLSARVSHPVSRYSDCKEENKSEDQLLFELRSLNLFYYSHTMSVQWLF